MTSLARLTALAQELIVRVRDEDPEANARWLTYETTAEERTALLFVLAAAVPDDRPWSQLVEWVDGPADPVERRRTQWRESQRRRRAA